MIDGAIRDAQGLGELGMPVFAAGITPAGPYKHGPGRLDVPVAIGGVVVQPGDIVVGDSDGVVVVAAAEAAEAEAVLERAQAVVQREADKRVELDALGVVAM